MPSRRFEQMLSNITDREYRDAERNYRNRHPEADAMSFEEYIQSRALQDDIQETHRDDIRASRAHFAANFSDHPFRARNDREYYERGFTHGGGDRRGIGTGGYEDYHGNEYTAGARGHPSAPPHSGPSNAYGPGNREVRHSTDYSVNSGGHDHRQRAPPSSRHDGRPLDGRSAAQSSYTDTSSRHYGNQQDPHSYHRDDSYDSHGGPSTRHGGSSASQGRHGGRRNHADDRGH